MTHAYICDAIRTPFGRYGGALSSVRTDDLGAIPIKALMARNPNVDWGAVTDVLYGCANQAGEDNRNVAHMASLLAGLPVGVPGATINRLCGSGLDAVGTAARAIRCGDASMVIAGGVESMSRAPFVMAKAETAFGRSAQLEDTTMGWRLVNPRMRSLHGTDTMPQTAEALRVVGGKTIVLTGAMSPARFRNSDATFNTGFAIGALQALPHGVYIAMNGRVFEAGKVRKNLQLGCFEAV